MKTKLIITRRLSLIVSLCFIIYGISLPFLHKTPILVYKMEKVGIAITDSIDTNVLDSIKKGEYYVFENKTEKASDIYFFHYSIMEKIKCRSDSMPIGKFVIQPYSIVCLSATNGLIDQIRICESNYRPREDPPCTNIDAAMLRFIGTTMQK